MSGRTILPVVWVYPTNDGGDSSVRRRLRRAKQLADINSKLLDWVIKGWSNRNSHPVEGRIRGLAPRQPTLQFPLVLGQIYEGDVILALTRDGGGSLNLLERMAVRRAFRFSPAPRTTEVFTTDQALNVLGEQAIAAMKAQDRPVFEDIFDEMTDLHTSMLQFGETRDDGGKAFNYAIVTDAGQFGTLAESWARSYRRLFEEAVGFIDRDPHFFHKVTWTSYKVVGRSLSMPSLTGVASVIDFQGYLWLCLNRWWERLADQQGLSHGVRDPAILAQPFAGVHIDALRQMIEPWENLLNFGFRPELEKRDTWEAMTALYPLLAEHLSETVLFVAKATLSGNRDAVNYWIDVLLRWCGNALPWNSDQHLHEMNLVQRIGLTPPLSGQTWSQVHDFVRRLSDYNHDIHTPASVFANLVFSMWQDAGLVLTAFLVQWSGTGDGATSTLAIDAARRLLHGQLIDRASTDGRTAFYLEQSDFLASFLRRISRRAWVQDSSVPGFWQLASHLDRLTEAPMMGGRIYSGTGGSADGVQVADLIVGSLRLRVNPIDLNNVVSRFPQWLADDAEAEHLSSSLGIVADMAESLDVTGLSPLFDFLRSAPERRLEEDEAPLPVIEPERNSSEQDFHTSLEAFVQLIRTLQDQIGRYRRQRLVDSAVSPEKLISLARSAASAAFATKDNDLLSHLFGSVTYTPMELTRTTWVWSRFRKGVITDPRLDRIGGSEDILAQMVSQTSRLHIARQLSAAKRDYGVERRVLVSSESEFASAFLAAAAELRAGQLEPIALMSSDQLTRWMQGWPYAAFRQNVQLPDGIEVTNMGTRQRNGYQFDVNRVPVYATNFPLGGIWVTSRRTFGAFKVTRANAEAPAIELRFESSEENPCEGDLSAIWKQDVETDNSPLIHLVYELPQNSE